MREAEADPLGRISPFMREPRVPQQGQTERAPYQIGNVSVKHVQPSRANVMVPCSCLVNRQATWRPKDCVLQPEELSSDDNALAP